MQSLIKVGTVTKTHGLNGAVKMIPEGENQEAYLDLKKLFIGKTEQTSDLFAVENASIMQNHVLFELGSVNTIEAAKKLLNQSVFVTQKIYDSLDIQILDIDLKGFKILDVNKKELIGEVIDLEMTKAHPILTVLTGNQKEILIPFVDKWILDIKKRSKTIEMNLPDGLLDV